MRLTPERRAEQIARAAMLDAIRRWSASKDPFVSIDTRGTLSNLGHMRLACDAWAKSERAAIDSERKAARPPRALVAPEIAYSRLLAEAMSER